MHGRMTGAGGRNEGARSCLRSLSQLCLRVGAPIAGALRRHGRRGTGGVDGRDAEERHDGGRRSFGRCSGLHLQRRDTDGPASGTQAARKAPA